MPNASTTLLPCLLTGLLLTGQPSLSAEQESTTNTADLPSPEAWDAGPDRETLVRFARAFGLVKSVLEAADVDADLHEPAGLPEEVRADVQRHISNNGLDEADWADLLARMDADPAFRNRVEMLATPYRTPTR